MKRAVLLFILPCFIFVPAVVLMRYCWAVFVSPDRAWRLAVSLDQHFNAASNGHEDETVSSRAARARDERRAWGCVLCRLLDWLDPNHCDNNKGV